jgi:hypothetical protein
MNITQLGEPRFPSPANHPVNDEARIPQHIIQDPEAPPAEQAFFEIASPQRRERHRPRKAHGTPRLDGEGGFLAALERRIRERSHAVIVVAEGAGQDLLDSSGQERDASGNVILKDIGVFLRQQIEAQKIPVLLRYFDPSYEIRSCTAGSEDAIFCDLLARHAVHAAMAGKTGLVIGDMHWDVYPRPRADRDVESRAQAHRSRRHLVAGRPCCHRPTAAV